MEPMFAGIFVGIFGLALFVFLGAITLAAFIFWIWMLVHAVTNRGLGDGEKIAWVLVILFTHFIGAAIYFFIGRPKQLGSSF
jgi:hypothetical protein